MDDNNVLIDEQTLYDIADAIRRKNGETTKYLPEEMPPAIDAIPVGSGASLAGNLAIAYEGLTFPVSVGTHCIYEDNYYVSTVAIETAEPFDPAKWARITAGVEIQGITDDLSNKVDKVTGKGLSTNDFTDEDKTNLVTLVAESDYFVRQAIHTGALLSVNANHSHALDNMLVYGKSVQNGTPSAGTPVPITSTNVSVCMANDNLIPTHVAGSYTARGFTITCNDDGTILFDGERDSGTGFARAFEIATFTLQPGQYRCKGMENAVGNTTVTLQLYDATNAQQLTNLDSSTPDGSTFRLNKPATVNAFIGIRSGANAQNLLIKPYLCINDGVTREYIPNNSITINLSDLVLRGMQVNANGNYTDGSGSMWLCDMLDSGRRKVIRYTKQIASYNGEVLPREWISNMDVYTEGATPTTGATVVYGLAYPVIEDLTSTQILEVLKMSVNKGLNIIYANDLTSPDISIVV